MYAQPMYLTKYAAGRALEILARNGHKAEAIGASRPRTGILYKIVVQAPWLPRSGMTVTVERPSHLFGFGATTAEVNDIEQKTAAGVS